MDNETLMLPLLASSLPGYLEKLGATVLENGIVNHRGFVRFSDDNGREYLVTVEELV